MTAKPHLLIGLVLGFSFPFVPLAAQDATPVQTSQADACTILASMVGQPDSRSAIFSRALQEMKVVMLRNDADLAALEKELPGSLDQLTSAMSPVLRRHSDRVTDQYLVDLAAAFRGAFNEQEARRAVTFYGSPLGQKMLRAAAKNMSYDKIIGEAFASAEAPQISADAVRGDMQATIAGITANIGAADRAAIAMAL